MPKNKIYASSSKKKINAIECATELILTNLVAVRAREKERRSEGRVCRDWSNADESGWSHMRLFFHTVNMLFAYTSFWTAIVVDLLPIQLLCVCVYVINDRNIVNCWFYVGQFSGKLMINSMRIFWWTINCQWRIYFVVFVFGLHTVWHICWTWKPCGTGILFTFQLDILCCVSNSVALTFLEAK